MRATVIGSGPNGLAAAVVLARTGYDVHVIEAAPTIGGGARTAELTLAGFRHDVASAVHPAALSSPLFRAFGLRERIEWIVPEISYAQPLEDGRAAIAWRSIERTADSLGADASSWRAMLRPLSTHLPGLVDFTGSQLLRVPRHPVTAVRFGLRALQVGTAIGRWTFTTQEAAALLTGVLAHANTPQPSLAAAASRQFIADLEAHGGEVETGRRIDSLTDVDVGDPGAGDLLVLDTSPRLLLTHPGIPSGYARGIRSYRYGAAAAKVDFALDGPVPWTNPDVARAPTVHLGGTRDEVEASENAVAAGRVTTSPYVLAVQPSVLDDTRAPLGKEVLWAYIHVPAHSTLDPTELVTAQVERFAPGFRDVVLASSALSAADIERSNPAAIGGDILGGAFSMVQSMKRPIISRTPWRTPIRGVYLASASTPPGPGVTGMPGWYAARQALSDYAGVRIDLDDVFG